MSDKKAARNIRYAIKKLEGKGAIAQLEKCESTKAAEDLLEAYKELECVDVLKDKQDQTLIGFCQRIVAIVKQVLSKPTIGCSTKRSKSTGSKSPKSSKAPRVSKAPKSAKKSTPPTVIV